MLFAPNDILNINQKPDLHLYMLVKFKYSIHVLTDIKRINMNMILCYLAEIMCNEQENH